MIVGESLQVGLGGGLGLVLNQATPELTRHFPITNIRKAQHAWGYKWNVSLFMPNGGHMECALDAE